MYLYMMTYNSKAFLSLDYFSVKTASVSKKLHKHATILTDNMAMADVAFALNSYTLDIA